MQRRLDRNGRAWTVLDMLKSWRGRQGEPRRHEHVTGVGGGREGWKRRCGVEAICRCEPPSPWLCWWLFRHLAALTRLEVETGGEDKRPDVSFSSAMVAWSATRCPPCPCATVCGCCYVVSGP